jgi:hypothetical protein
MVTKRGASDPLVKDATPKKQKKTSATDSAEATAVSPTTQIGSPAAPGNEDENDMVTPTKKGSNAPTKEQTEDATAIEDGNAVAAPKKGAKGGKAATPKNGKKGGKVATPAKGKTSTPKKPPVGDGFNVWHQPFGPLPGPNPFWGARPLPGDPRPDPVQPAARDSDGAVNPPLWEDLGYRFKRGSRFVKYFYREAPDNADDSAEDKDQEDMLYMKMMDMRPVGPNDPTIRRQPHFYCYGKVPKDWDNMQSMKALNDRYFQAVGRITLDPNWTRIEREYLAQLLSEFPDASIWELTERHNDRFMGKDYTADTGFPFANLSPGRTVESVRYEYTQYKPSYDRGQTPKNVRDRKDTSAEAERIEKYIIASFGKPGEDSAENKKTPAGTKRSRKKKDKPEVVEVLEDEGEDETAQDETAPTDPFAGQPPLEDEIDEELLELAVEPTQPVSSSARQSTPSKGLLPSSAVSSPLSSAPSSPLSSPRNIPTPTGMTPPKRGKPVVNSAVEEVPKQGAEVKKVVNQTVKNTKTKTAPGKQHTSNEASRKIEIDEEYDDEVDEEL